MDLHRSYHREGLLKTRLLSIVQAYLYYMALQLNEVVLLIEDPSDSAQTICKTWLSYFLPFGLCSAVKEREEDNYIMTIYNES